MMNWVRTLCLFITFFILTDNSGASSYPLKINETESLHSIWSGGAHPYIFVDDILITHDLKKTVMVKYNIRRNEKLKHDIWFKAGQGNAIHLSNGERVTALYAEGFDHPRELQSVIQHFRRKPRSSAALWDALWFQTACAETTSQSPQEHNLKNRQDFHRDRQLRQQAGQQHGFLRCLGEGTLSGLTSFADSARSVGRFLHLLATEPVEAWRQASISLRESLEFVLNIQEELKKGLDFLRLLSPEMASLIVCQAAGEVIVSVGIGVLAGGLVTAISRAAPVIKKRLASLYRHKNQLLAIDRSQNHSSQQKQLSIQNFFRRTRGKGVDLTTPESLNRATLIPDQDLAELRNTLTDRKFRKFIGERKKDLGFQSAKPPFLRLTEVAESNPLGQILKRLQTRYGVELMDSPMNSAPLYDEKGKGQKVINIDPQMLAQPNLFALRLQELEKLLELNQSRETRYGIRLNPEGQVLFPEGGESKIRTILQRLQTLHNVEVTFDKKSLDEGAAGHAQGRTQIVIDPDFLLPGKEEELQRVLFHEIAHARTTARAEDSASNQIRLGKRKGQRFIGVPAQHAGREMIFRTNGAKGLHPLYKENFRADEMEARLRELGGIDPVSQDWKNRVQDVTNFIERQENMLRKLRHEQILRVPNTDGVYQLKGSLSGKPVSIEVDIRAYGSGIPSAQRHKVVRDIIEERLTYLQKTRASLASRSSRGKSQEPTDRDSSVSLEFVKMSRSLSTSQNVQIMDRRGEPLQANSAFLPGRTYTAVIDDEDRLILGFNIPGEDGRSGGNKSHQELLRLVRDPDPDLYSGNAGSVRVNPDGTLDISGFHMKQPSLEAANRIRSALLRAYPEARTRVTPDRLSTLGSFSDL